MRGYKTFEANPHPGELRHLVEIGYTENVINENGYPNPTDVVVCKVWAAASSGHCRFAIVTSPTAADDQSVCEQLRAALT